MPAEIRRLTPVQFIHLLQSAAATLSRRIDAVHLHHTWRPTRSQFKGLATIEAMRKYHMQTNGWKDIAQHLTIDPQGMLWTGRNWNAPPASQAGKNGTAAQGPFMIEMVGDFDAGKEVLDGEQRGAVVSVVASLLQAFSLTVAAVHFHRDLGSPKTCPGSGVDKAALLEEIKTAVAALGSPAKPAARARGGGAIPFGPRHWLGHEVTLPAEEPEPGFERCEIAEHQMAAESIGEQAWLRSLAALEISERDLAPARSSKWEALRPYVVNLTKGRLSRSGEFQMPDGSIEAIVDSIARYAAATDRPRLMLHAHGGLASETSALSYAQAAHGWWLEHGIYPVYFVWETGVFEVLKQRLGLARGVFGDARDYLFEATARAAGGKLVWGYMKESARLAASRDAGNGEAGGARIFASAIAPLITAAAAGKGLTVHAVGHSAGAIFQAHLLPYLIGLGVTIESLAFLAPAIRIDLFKQLLHAPIQSQQIRTFEMFTMDEEAERDDDCVEPLGVTLYGKSLLYLVSRAFEPKRKTPILGLYEMLRRDPTIKALFQGSARLELAHARGKPPNPATKARKHGCFDNDAATMASVLQTIAQLPPGTPFTAVSADCAEGGARVLPPLAVAPDLSPARPFSPANNRLPATAIRRRALCVGIDRYRDRPLAGCVHDAGVWERTLTDLKFEVTTLLDNKATRRAVLEALQTLVESAHPGELLVFQYSGHGTQVEDSNGDESDRYDEALVPIDYHTGALLLDDDLAEIYRRVPEGVVLSLFMDCCHSGTNSRFAPIGRPHTSAGVRRRFLDLPAEVQEAHRRFRARIESPRPTSAEESLPGVIHFAACLDNQYAYESNGQGHFTQLATAHLAQAVARAVTNESFAMDVASKVAALGQPQTPRLMRLPATLSERPLLAGGTVHADAAPAGAERKSDEWYLQFFESATADWRQRLGR